MIAPMRWNWSIRGRLVDLEGAVALPAERRLSISLNAADADGEQA
jgi:hypothetical protein